VITAVDLSVSEYERRQRLQEVWGRMENRSAAKLKSGHTFRKQDMMRPGQTLKHQGPLLWKTATGRLKDVLALLLTDALIFLQEKDQKFTFAAVDQKPPVIALQKLIVREVANEERGMFLISASAAGPEMYEVHTSSKEERNTWMRLIREILLFLQRRGGIHERVRGREAKSLLIQDQKICSSLEEKLQVYAALSALSGRTDYASLVEPRLLVQPQAEETPQAAVLLTAALQEGAHVVLMLVNTLHFINLTLSSFPFLFQAAVTVQDSSYEVNRLLLRESGRPSPRTQQRSHLPSVRVNSLQEQEKQRNLEKRKEEVASARRLQGRLRQEKERWERECQARESQQGEQESRLEERERQCHLEAERLRRERDEFEEQLEEYQQSLERLREGQRSVERERERLESQENLLQTWRHSRQSSLPAVNPHMVIPLDGTQVQFDHHVWTTRASGTCKRERERERDAGTRAVHQQQIENIVQSAQTHFPRSGTQTLTSYLCNLVSVQDSL
uniref:Rho guanine nucleotide exchange factor (GEF) 28a n=1 Tax=Labrus bergylta TaxID=56723 RepID=A0A3Q3G9G1_9LABR